MERAAGIEPASLAWKAKVLPLHNARSTRLTLRTRPFQGQALAQQFTEIWSSFECRYRGLPRTAELPLRNRTRFKGSQNRSGRRNNWIMRVLQYLNAVETGFVSINGLPQCISERHAQFGTDIELAEIIASPAKAAARTCVSIPARTVWSATTAATPRPSTTAPGRGPAPSPSLISNVHSAPFPTIPILRSPAFPNARIAARVSSLIPTSTQQNARSAPHPSSPTPAHRAR